VYQRRSIAPPRLRISRWTDSPLTVAAFKRKFEPNLYLPTRRENFSDDQISQVTPSEQLCVTLTGFIVRAVKQGPESANCGDPKRTDIHVWIYTDTSQNKDRRTGLRGKAVVAEVTPRWLDNHPDWTHTRLEKIAQDRLRVKISGWVMYDPEHPPHMGKTRGTLWELHPITKIQYWDGTAWRNL